MLFRRFYLIFIGLAFFLKAHGQPSACSNPSLVGGIAGGNFTVQPSVCLNGGPATLNVAADVNNFTSVGYIYGYKEGQVITNLNTSLSADVSSANIGDYWIMQVGKNTLGTNIKCQKVVVIDPILPNVAYTTCQQSLKIKILSATSNNYDTYFIDWGDQSAITPISVNAYPYESTHTYVGVRSFVIKIIARNSSVLNCTSADLSFQFTPNNNLHINRLEMLSKGTSALIDFVNTDLGIDFIVKAEKNATGNWQAIGSGKGSSTTVLGLDSTANYCFRLEGTDACGSAVKSLPVCSIALSAGAVSPSEVKLNWNKPLLANTTPTFTVTRAETGISPISLSPSPISNTVYDDLALRCNKTYTYQVSGSYNDARGNSVQSVSASKNISTNGVRAILPALEPIGAVNVEHDSSQIKVLFKEISPQPLYRFERMTDDDFNNWTVTAEKNENDPTRNIYIDKNADPTKHRYCYRISYGDACGNWSQPTIPLCTILLTSDAPSTLSWTPFIENASYQQYVRYDVLEADPITGLPIGNPILGRLSDTKAIINSTKDKTYIIHVVYSPPTANGETYSFYSNTFNLSLPAQLYVPNAFTPNGDLENPTFKIQGTQISGFNIIIFDRWGNIIFESNDINKSWDGTFSDQTTAVPFGNYAYIINFIDTKGEAFNKTGSVMLIR